MNALSEVATAISRERDFDAILTTAGERLRAFGLRVLVIQFRGDELFLRYVNQAPTPPFGAEVVKPVNRHSHFSFAGFKRVSESPSPIAWLRLEEFLQGPGPEGLDAWAQARGFERGITSALRVNGRDWGNVSICSNTIEPGDVAALTLFCCQLKGALEVAEVINGLERRNKALEAVHQIATGAEPARSHHLLERVAKATGSDSAMLHRFDAARKEFVQEGEPWGYHGPLAQKWKRFQLSSAPSVLDGLKSASAHQFPKVADEAATEGFEEFTTVPLRVEGGQPVGLLSLGRKTPRPYTEQELHTAEILGVQVASLLERQRLHDEASRRVRQLSLLYELTSAGALTSQVEPVIDKLLLQMLDAFPCEVAVIHFVEGKQFRLAGYRLRESVMPAGPPTPEYLPVDDSSVVGLAARTRQPYRASMGTFPPFTEKSAQRLGLSHLMAAPLLVGERLVGTLALGRQPDHPFTDEEVKLAEGCAMHIAVILEHVRLYEDLKQSYDDLARAQAEVVRHERLAALGEVAAVMAHEVRNPLGVIFNSLTGLKRLLNVSGDAEMLMRIMGEEADRLNRIVGDLLDFARPYEPNKKPVSPEPLLASAIDAATQAVPIPNLKVVTDLSAELPVFLVDAHLMRQALVNLVVNALQAMPKGGTATLRVRAEKRGLQKWAVIDVHDEGVGITPQSAERIFQPFFTTKATGTGLGLAVVKRIIDAHHGMVTVQSKPGEGTTFTVRLPASEEGVSERTLEDRPLPAPVPLREESDEGYDDYDDEPTVIRPAADKPAPRVLRKDDDDDEDTLPPTATR